jgi:nucleotide-binding universal stress UspA family protein
MFTTVLVAIDGSPGAKRALEAAVEFARRDGADLVGVTVQVPLARHGTSAEETEEERELDTRASQVLVEEAAAYAVGHGRRMRTLVRVGHPAREIVQAAAEEYADLIVLGHSGHSGVWGRFMGTTAEKVSRHANASVLIVR